MLAQAAIGTAGSAPGEEGNRALAGTYSNAPDFDHRPPALRTAFVQATHSIEHESCVMAAQLNTVKINGRHTIFLSADTPRTALTISTQFFQPIL
jgi:hypothetical protein